MQDKKLVTISAGLLVLIIATTLYLHKSLAPAPGIVADPAGDTAGSAAKGPQPSDTTGSDSIAGGAEPSLAPSHPDQTEKVVPEKYASNPPKPAWEKDLISLFYRRDMGDLDKARQLLAKITTLPPDGKVLAMEFATQLIPDQTYPQLRPWIFQLGDSNDLREAILVDVLTRGESVRMPTLVELLRQPPNPAQQEIREILVAYLDKDHGNDFPKWDAAVQQFLLENPEE